jgi:hypothetical protein
MVRPFKLVMSSLLLLATPGCSFLIGTVPEPDPIYKAAVNYADQPLGCLSADAKFVGNKRVHQNLVCENSDQRVAHYLQSLLPATPKRLEEKLQNLEFACRENAEADHGVLCEYGKTQAIRACMTTYTVHVTVKYKANAEHVEGIATNVSVQLGSSPDAQGCFPL